MGDWKPTQILTGMSDALRVGVGDFIDELTAVLIGIAAVSVLAMAFVNTFKGFVRPWYVRQRVLGAMEEHGSPEDAKAVEAFIVRVTTFEQRSFYGQEIPAVVGSLTGAKNYALHFPSDPDSIDFFKLWIDKDGSAQKVWKKVEAKDNLDQEDRARLGAAIDARINSIKVSTSTKWDRGTRNAARAVSVLGVLFLGDFETKFDALIFGLFAGMLAPFAHDLVTRIAKAKIKP